MNSDEESSTENTNQTVVKEGTFQGLIVAHSSGLPEERSLEVSKLLPEARVGTDEVLTKRNTSTCLTNESSIAEPPWQ